MNLRRTLAVAFLLTAAPVLADNPQFQGADPHATMIGNELWVFPTGGPGEAVGAVNAS